MKEVKPQVLQVAKSFAKGTLQRGRAFLQETLGKNRVCVESSGGRGEAGGGGGRGHWGFVFNMQGNTWVSLF